MSIYGTVQSFDVGKWVELFILDATNLDAGYFYFVAGENELGGNIIWQGQEYVALPIEASEFAYDGKSFPRPKLKVANIQGVFSSLIHNYNDLVGAKVTRTKVAVMYLDAVNFSGGNPLANPSEHLEPEIYFITQKSSENKLFIEFELGSSLDLSGVFLPKRALIANICPFRYRQEECGYAGSNYWNSFGVPVTTLAEDKCSKTIDGCKLRFGSNGELSFGGFPGSSLAGQ